MDDVSVEKAHKLPQIVAAFTVSIGAFGMGCGFSWTSPVLPRISGEEPTDDTFAEPFTTEQASWIASLYTIGCLAGSIATGYLNEAIGRKWTNQIMGAPFLAGWLLLALTGTLELTSPWYFYVGRIITGFGGGGFILGSTIYIVEISEPHIRGSLNTLMQLMLCLGILFVNGVGALVTWQLLTYLCLIPPILVLLLVPFLPETPYYLVSKHRMEQARKSLKWLRGKHYDIEEELKKVIGYYENRVAAGQISFTEQMTNRVYALPLLTLLVITVFQQWCGINGVLFYLTDIFDKTKSNIDSGLSASLVALVRTIATGCCVLAVERFGRKPLLIASASLMCTSLFALAAYFTLEHKLCQEGDVTKCITQATLDSLAWLPVTALMIYVSGFALGYGPLPWAMNGEFFSLEAKGISSTTNMTFNWLNAFLVSKFQSNIEEQIDTYGLYYMYACICFVSIPFVLFLVPETKGKSPLEMKRKYMKKKDREELLKSNEPK